MSTLTAEPQTSGHPVLRAVAHISEALAEVASVDPAYMRASEKAAALVELARVEAQVAGLRLRVAANGSANLAQARVIAKTLDDLPSEIPTEVIAKAEETLVGHCAQFGPRQLARLGRRIVEVVAPQIADAAEARALARLEEKAHRATRLAFHRVGDGTTRITGLLPDLAATRLVTYLEAFTNPRKDHRPPTGQLAHRP
jgi:hypothetical protein